METRQEASRAPPTEEEQALGGTLAARTLGVAVDERALEGALEELA